MNEQNNMQVKTLPYPSQDDRAGWQAYWQQQGQLWRSEPEIDVERQQHLAERRAVAPDVMQGIYSFRDIKLSRADVEWLLATHENGRGPVDYNDENQRQRVGLDLRGADLRGVDLHNLPLARTLGDVAWREWPDLTEEQHVLAAIHFEKADLKGAHLEGAELEYAFFEGADLRRAHMEDANLAGIQMQRAYLEGTNCKGADLWLAQLDGAFIWATNLAGTNMSQIHLQEAHIDHRVVLANEQGVGPRMVDAHLGEVNLASINWAQVKMPGDEYTARQEEQDGKVKDRETRLREFEEAVRANRQLAIVLQEQGLSEESARFAYRAQVLQRKFLWLQGPRKLGSYLFSLFLAMLTGYGYRMWRIIIVYAVAVSIFALLYYSLSINSGSSLTLEQACILSVTAFHGRVFSSPFATGSAQSIVAACEAVTGLVFEGVFIAMLTQRFFGK